MRKVYIDPVGSDEGIHRTPAGIPVDHLQFWILKEGKAFGTICSLSRL